MLPVHLSFGRPGANFRIDGAVSRQLGCYAIGFEGLTFDNRFLGGSWGAHPGWVIVGRVRAGELLFEGEVLGAGAAFVIPAPVLTSRTTVIRTRGDEVVLVALRVREEDFLIAPASAPTRIASPRWSGAFDALEDRLTRRAPPDDGLARVLRELLEGLATHGLIRDGAAGARTALTSADRVVARVASAVFPMLSRLAKRPAMIDLIERTGLTERQLSRDLVRVQTDFELLDRGWRQALFRWRVTAGALLLSAEDVSLQDAARLAGYASLKAMGRAFADAGLPSPSEVRDLI